MILDGKHYKLDLTIMKYSKDDYMKPKELTTFKGTPFTPKVFPDRECELKFNPIGKVEEGLNLVVLVFSQYLTYGYFDGYCKVGNETIAIQKVYGHVEHVHNRW